MRYLPAVRQRPQAPNRVAAWQLWQRAGRFRLGSRNHAPAAHPADALLRM